MSEFLQVVCPFCDAINPVSSARLADQAVCGQCKQPLCTGVPLELTADNFERHVSDSDVPILVDFWAPWCGPCQMVGPTIEELAGEFDGVKICKVNVDEEGLLAQQYGIMSIPAVYIFKNGEVKQTIIGAQAKATYREAIQKEV